MEKWDSLTVKSKTISILSEADQPKLGQWYWVTQISRWDGDHDLKKGDSYKWLGCVMKIGSNFVELHTPHNNHKGHEYTRIHFDDFFKSLELEKNPQSIMDENISHWQFEVKSLLGKVRDVTARLGISQKKALPTQDENSTALMAVSGKDNIVSYKKDLILAKEETLPELFEAIKSAEGELCAWMMAETMETRASIIPMENSIDEINNRIFAVGLYAGLEEHIKKISDGEPAAISAKLHIMQRKAFMDEECLLNYKSGGMEFKDISEFDKWIARPKNRDRILPFPRTMVAMQVRRKVKDRDWEGDLLKLFINFHSEISDKFTYLYVRNGEQLSRVSCEIEFDDMIFPDKNIYDPAGLKMVKMFCEKVDEIIPLSLYEEVLKEYKTKKAKSKQWEKEHPKEHYFKNPFRDFDRFNPDDWAPFDQSNVHFDECMESIASEVRKYNRVALIVQGLFDRSLILHPHLPAKTWSPAGFDQVIKLVYDGEMTLHYGQAPDFEAYRAAKNKSLMKGSVTTGQNLYWQKMEAKKENARMDAS
jgi:hypothetical protein